MILDVETLMKGFMNNPLFTENELYEGLPKLYSDVEASDPMVYKKLTGTLLSWTWYLLEGDRETGILMAYVEGEFNEIGSVSISDLKSVGAFIDKEFKPTRLSNIRGY